jgi:hypothetical protein
MLWPAQASLQSRVLEKYNSSSSLQTFNFRRRRKYSFTLVEKKLTTKQHEDDALGGLKSNSTSGHILDSGGQHRYDVNKSGQLHRNQPADP